MDFEFHCIFFSFQKVKTNYLYIFSTHQEFSVGLIDMTLGQITILGILDVG